MPREYDLAYARYASPMEEESSYESETGEKPTSEVEGYEQVFDMTVELRPIDLMPIPAKR